MWGGTMEAESDENVQMAGDLPHIQGVSCSFCFFHSADCTLSMAVALACSSSAASIHTLALRPGSHGIPDSFLFLFFLALTNTQTGSVRSGVQPTVPPVPRGTPITELHTTAFSPRFVF